MKTRNKKRPPHEFDCEQCGNPLYKSRVKDSIRCCYCGYVNEVGRYRGRFYAKNKN